MKVLSMVRFAAATQFLETYGRPLDRALFRYEFSRADEDQVVAQLVAYQNDDGGFAHRLEPDAVSAVSSVLDTTHALQIFERLDLATDHPRLLAAITYLRGTYREEFVGWPIRPFAGAEAVCAPWWKSEDESRWRYKMKAGRLNPTAEVLGYLLDYGDLEDTELIASVSDQVSRWIDASDVPLESHELLCLARLTRSKKLNESKREAWSERVRRDVAATVPQNPTQWTGYILKPWWVAETPDDPLLAGLANGLIDAMLDHEIDQQDEAGSWPPFWDWGGLHPEAWAVARTEWASVLTEQMLRVLRNFGRLPIG